MATTLDDAKIRIVVDTTAAEEAARELLKKRKGQRGAPGGGGGGQPPIAPPTAGDEPEPADGGGGGGGGPGTIAALAAGNVAGIPGIRGATQVASIVLAAEVFQRVAGNLAGFFKQHTADEALHALADPREMVRILVDEAMHAAFEQIEQRIADLETFARGVLSLIQTTHEVMEAMDTTGIVAGELPDKEFLWKIIEARTQQAFAESDLREARQQVRREMFGSALRDKADALAKDAHEAIEKAFSKH